MVRSFCGAAREIPSPALRGEREGPSPQGWEGAVGVASGGRSEIPRLTPTLSTPGGEREFSPELTSVYSLHCCCLPLS